MSCLDLKSNQIDDRDQIIPFFTQLKNLNYLYLKGNPCVRFISQYRKSLARGLQKLYYLDDRPVNEIERKMADAWIIGGDQEEERARLAFI